MSEHFNLEIVNPEKSFLKKDNVAEVIVPGFEGEMGILKDHISIIDPKIIILLGSTAMEAIIPSNQKISQERGKWKEIILKNKTYPLITTFSPSYLIRFPENKKFSWEDLKKIKQKILDLKIQI